MSERWTVKRSNTGLFLLRRFKYGGEYKFFHEPSCMEPNHMQKLRAHNKWVVAQCERLNWLLDRAEEGMLHRFGAELDEEYGNG